jgi:hypothetical protein|uniref:Uncharacterized protein n=1 Tax=Myoviridae sp. ctshb19 TaxID=2825194 RepID=A0A8S5UGY4_9CAUD|nr:MAG TPA: hypothetical protein [Myoviridae sp. ctshb19]
MTDALNTHSNLTTLIDEIKKLVEFSRSEPQPEQQEIPGDNPWQKLGEAIAESIRQENQRPGLAWRLWHGRHRWRFNAGANKAKPLTHQRKKRLAAMRERTRYYRTEKCRLRFAAILNQFGLK